MAPVTHPALCLPGAKEPLGHSRVVRGRKGRRMRGREGEGGGWGGRGKGVARMPKGQCWSADGVAEGVGWVELLAVEPGRPAQGQPLTHRRTEDDAA